jgi:polar amino acid transport system substrate-binding protein
MRRTRGTVILPAAALAGLMAVSACSSDPTDPTAPSTPVSGSAGGGSAPSAVPTVPQDAALHNALPGAVKSAGKLTIATINSQPPWAIPASNPNEFTGAASDMASALQQLLGVKFERHAVADLASVVPGIQAKRYDFALGPVGDTVSAEKQVDFVDWAKEKVVFAVPKGNPKKLTSLDTTCGLRIGVIAGGASETILKDQTKKCQAAGKPAVTIQDYAQQPQAILAVESGRSDSYFSSRALLTYYVQQSKGGLELTSEGSDNGYPANFYQGAVFPKDGSALRDSITKAFQELKKDGTYDAILSKWGLAYMSVPEFGVNLVGGGQ